MILRLLILVLLLVFGVLTGDFLADLIRTQCSDIKNLFLVNALAEQLPKLCSLLFLWLFFILVRMYEEKQKKQIQTDVTMAAKNPDDFLATMPASVLRACEQKAEDPKKLSEYLKILYEDKVITKIQALLLLNIYREKAACQEISRQQPAEPAAPSPAIHPTAAKEVCYDNFLASIPPVVKHGCNKKAGNPRELQTYLEILANDRVITEEQADFLMEFYRDRTPDQEMIQQQEAADFDAMMASVPDVVKHGCNKKAGNPRELQTYLEILANDRVITEEQADFLMKTYKSRYPSIDRNPFEKKQ